MHRPHFRRARAALLSPPAPPPSLPCAALCPLTGAPPQVVFSPVVGKDLHLYLPAPPQPSSAPPVSPPASARQDNHPAAEPAAAGAGGYVGRGGAAGDEEVGSASSDDGGADVQESGDAAGVKSAQSESGAGAWRDLPAARRRRLEEWVLGRVVLAGRAGAALRDITEAWGREGEGGGGVLGGAEGSGGGDAADKAALEGVRVPDAAAAATATASAHAKFRRAMRARRLWW